MGELERVKAEMQEKDATTVNFADLLEAAMMLKAYCKSKERCYRCEFSYTTLDSGVECLLDAKMPRRWMIMDGDYDY